MQEQHRLKDEEERLLTVDEVARFLSVPKSFIYGKTRTNEIPVCRIGKRYCRFSLPAIREWAKGQQQEGAGAR